jgi:hypothetical protein
VLIASKRKRFGDQVIIKPSCGRYFASSSLLATTSSRSASSTYLQRHEALPRGSSRRFGGHGFKASAGQDYKGSTDRTVGRAPRRAQF